MNYQTNEDKRDNWGYGLYNTVLSVNTNDEGLTEPVTRAEAKLWAKIETSDDDDIVDALITAARQICEQFSGIGFIQREIVASIENNNGGFFLPYGPVEGDPEATDEYGNEVTPTYNMGQVQDPYGKLVVTYQGGHETLPQNLKTALKAQFLFLYENRGESGIAPTAKTILEPLRVVL